MTIIRIVIRIFVSIIFSVIIFNAIWFGISMVDELWYEIIGCKEVYYIRTSDIPDRINGFEIEKLRKGEVEYVYDWENKTLPADSMPPCIVRIRFQKLWFGITEMQVKPAVSINSFMLFTKMSLYRGDSADDFGLHSLCEFKSYVRKILLPELGITEYVRNLPVMINNLCFVIYNNYMEIFYAIWQACTIFVVWTLLSEKTKRKGILNTFLICLIFFPFLEPTFRQTPILNKIFRGIFEIDVLISEIVKKQ